MDADVALEFADVYDRLGSMAEALIKYVGLQTKVIESLDARIKSLEVGEYPRDTSKRT